MATSAVLLYLPIDFCTHTYNFWINGIITTAQEEEEEEQAGRAAKRENPHLPRNGFQASGSVKANVIKRLPDEPFAPARDFCG